MTENKPIIINELGCNICPDKKRCDEQRERKDNIINSILDDIKDTAIAYNCNLKDKIEILKQNLPIITRCDIVLEKQLARKTQECDELTKNYIMVIQQRNAAEQQLDKLKTENEKMKHQIEVFTRQLENANKEVINEKKKNATERQKNEQAEQKLERIRKKVQAYIDDEADLTPEQVLQIIDEVER